MLGLFVQILNLVVWIPVAFDLAWVFGKGTGFGFGILFLSPIFNPILAFGDAQYNSSGGVRVSPAV